MSRLEQLLATLGQRVALLPTVCRSVAEAAEGIRDALSIVRPLPVGDKRYDARLAAVVDYWLTRDRLRRPEWLDQPAFTLEEPWAVEELIELRAHARSATPRSISRHGVYLASTELAST